VINDKPLGIASFHLYHIYLGLGKLPYLPNELFMQNGWGCSYTLFGKPEWFQFLLESLESMQN
jgi:hypothetical protein